MNTQLFYFLIAVIAFTSAKDVHQRAIDYLSRVGLRTSPNGSGEDKWITLCEVKARVANAGLRRRRDTQTCTRTTGGNIVETRVIRRAEWSCSYNTETYSSGTLLNYQHALTYQYDTAMKIAIDAGDKAAADYMESMKTQHIQNLKVATNRDTAKLTATATSAPWWRSGANCDLVLEARVRQFVN